MKSGHLVPLRSSPFFSFLKGLDRCARAYQTAEKWVAISSTASLSFLRAGLRASVSQRIIQHAASDLAFDPRNPDFVRATYQWARQTPIGDSSHASSPTPATSVVGKGGANIPNGGTTTTPPGTGQLNESTASPHAVTGTVSSPNGDAAAGIISPVGAVASTLRSNMPSRVSAVMSSQLAGLSSTAAAAEYPSDEASKLVCRLAARGQLHCLRPLLDVPAALVAAATATVAERRVDVGTAVQMKDAATPKEAEAGHAEECGDDDEESDRDSAVPPEFAALLRALSRVAS